MQSIMVPLDGSGLAEQALPMAEALARSLDVGLHLVLVRPSLPMTTGPTRGAEYLRHIAERIDLPRGVSHSVPVDEWGPLTTDLPGSDRIGSLLADAAAAAGAVLIVMTSNGHGGLRRAWLGSVADALVRLAPAPVLIIRPNEDAATATLRAERGFRHIVVPLDGSDAAEQAVAPALRAGAPFDARYTLLRVVSPLTWEAAPGMSAEAPDPEALGLSRQAAAASLDPVAARLREADVQVAVDTVMAAAAGAAIVDYAKDHAADLIALSSTGAGGMRRLLLGSTADKVIRSASVPVLVCNARDAARNGA